jgi:hypothetical protein
MRSLTTAILLGHAALASASDNSATVLPAEGNVQCSDYASNSTILQMSAKPVAAGTLSGAENPKDADTTGESAAYTVSGGKIVSFSAATTPIDYAVLKSGNSVSVLMYPSGGVTEDTDMRLTVNNVDKTITSISLCYGLGNAVEPPPPPPPLETLKSCDLDAILDATGVTCPDSGERTLVCNFELDKSFFGLNDGSDSCCVCNSAALTECDASQPAGGPNACISATGSKEGAEIPVMIMLNNDPSYTVCKAGVCKTYPY